MKLGELDEEFYLSFNHINIYVSKYLFDERVSIKEANNRVKAYLHLKSPSLLKVLPEEVLSLDISGKMEVEENDLYLMVYDGELFKVIDRKAGLRVFDEKDD